jgi:hypothetical protein
MAQSKRRRISLASKSIRVAANARRTIRLRLPAALRTELRRRGKVGIALTARVTDPAGNTRTATKSITPMLQKKARR